MKTYSEMTQAEAVLHRAMSQNAAGANPVLRPGHIAYLNKSAITLIARNALKEAEALIDA